MNYADKPRLLCRFGFHRWVRIGKDSAGKRQYRCGCGSTGSR